MIPKQFFDDRDAALLSLDKEKILAYCKKWHAHFPETELVFWASAHEARLIIDIPAEEKEKSRKWLSEHGFKCDY